MKTVGLLFLNDIIKYIDMNSYKNPFNITKANDFTDEEIIRYWVGFTDGDVFEKVIKPKSPMPMFLLGGKGSGKTHFMRYSSFELQKIRGAQNLLEQIQNEGFIGLYQKCSGLNSNRFTGKGQSEEVWKSIFSYYIELWLAELLLDVLLVIINELDYKIDQKKFCRDVLERIDKKELIEEICEVLHLKSYILSLRRHIDYEVNNLSLKKNNPDIKICVSPGLLIFELPYIVKQCIKEFKDVQIIYLIDEFENFTIYQQKYINTLLRERRGPATFRIGARLYGLKTMSTYAGDMEENKEGSEYEVYYIDSNFRDKRGDYKKFAYKVCAKRLVESGFVRSDFADYADFEDKLDLMFEEIDEVEYCKELVSSKDTNPYIRKLENNLTSIKYKDVIGVVQNLLYPDNPIIEMTNLFMFYRLWSKRKYDLIDASLIVKKSLQGYLNGENNNEHSVVLDKFKSDIVSKIKHECNARYYYSGLKSIVDMSEGITRLLLNILKHVYRWSEFNGEKPFGGTKISLDAQNRGIAEASQWFYDDINDSGKMKLAIERLGQFIREIRYSDIPPECSLVAVNIDITNLSENVIGVIDRAKKYSFLLEDSSRKEKNSRKISVLLRLNGVIATRWKLPIYKRGDFSLSIREVNAIFLDEYKGDYDEVLNIRKNKYNAPFKELTPIEIIQEKLFD